jgi:hypothetical protein
MKMAGILSEVNMSDVFIEPIKKVMKKKDKKPTMLEEQIRDTLPYCETEKAEEDEKL